MDAPPPDAPGGEPSASELLASLNRELAERKLIQEALRESEELYRTIVEHSNDMIWTLDREGRFLFFNRRSEEVTGYRLEDWRSKSFAPLIRESDLPKVGQIFQSTLAGKPSQYEVAVTGSDGRLLNLSVNTAPIWSHGKVVGTVSFGRDITELKRTEEAFRHYASRLEEANRMKDLFTDVMRHDLLVPLSVIFTASERLLQDEQEEQARRVLRMILRNAGKLSDMIRSASTYALLETAESLDREEIDMEEMLAMVVNGFQPQIDEKHLKIECTVTGDCRVRANPLINPVISNLLGNAIKYSPEGGKIDVTLGADGTHCTFSVKDRGPGIPAADRARLFTRFERGRAEKKVEGLGLGLAIVKRVVDLHGGRVWVEDNPEGGSVFSAQIPKG